MSFDLGHALDVLPALLRGLRVTVLATLLGMGLALVLGLAWTLLRRSRSRAVALSAELALEFVRSTPLLVQLYLLFFGLPSLGISLSPLTAGVLGLGLHYAAYVSEVYRTGIDGVPRGQWEAGLALGMSRGRVFRTIVLPQAMPPILPALGNHLVAMFKDTPLLATITVVEMLQVAKLEGARSFRYLEPMTMVGVIFLVLSLIAAALIRRVERWSARHA